MVGSKLLREEVNGQLTSLFEAVDAFGDLEVDLPIIGIGCEVVFVNNSWSMLLSLLQMYSG